MQTVKKSWVLGVGVTLTIVVWSVTTYWTLVTYRYLESPWVL